MQVLNVVAYIDHHMDGFAVERVGHQMIDKLRRQLPMGARVIDTKLHLTDCVSRLGKEMRFEVRFQEPMNPTGLPPYLGINGI